MCLHRQYHCEFFHEPSILNGTLNASLSNGPLLELLGFYAELNESGSTNFLAELVNHVLAHELCLHNKVLDMAVDNLLAGGIVCKHHEKRVVKFLLEEPSDKSLGEVHNVRLNVMFVTQVVISGFTLS